MELGREKGRGCDYVERARRLIGLQEIEEQAYTGKKIGIALFDTGIAAGHPDFRGDGKIAVFKDFINNKQGAYDDNGHGTHVAGIAGGTGIASSGKYRGIATQAHFIVIKILDHLANGNIDNVLQGVDWLIKNQKRYGIRVVNISIGSGKEEEIGEESELVQGINALWDAGMVVCAAAGNNGPTPGSIGAPGNSRKLITVGACDDNEEIILNGRTMKNYSGRGPTKCCIKKPDLVAPGSNIISCSSNWKYKSNFAFYGGGNQFYTVKSGTSMATPIVSGTVALLLEKYPEMSNREVKIRLKNRSEDMGLPHDKQGWGRLNAKKLLLD